MIGSTRPHTLHQYTIRNQLKIAITFIGLHVSVSKNTVNNNLRKVGLSLKQLNNNRRTELRAILVYTVRRILQWTLLVVYLVGYTGLPEAAEYGESCEEKYEGYQVAIEIDVS